MEFFDIVISFARGKDVPIQYISEMLKKKGGPPVYLTLYSVPEAFPGTPAVLACNGGRAEYLYLSGVTPLPVSSL